MYYISVLVPTFLATGSKAANFTLEEVLSLQKDKFGAFQTESCRLSYKIKGSSSEAVYCSQGVAAGQWTTGGTVLVGKSKIFIVLFSFILGGTIEEKVGTWKWMIIGPEKKTEIIEKIKGCYWFWNEIALPEAAAAGLCVTAEPRDAQTGTKTGALESSGAWLLQQREAVSSQLSEQKGGNQGWCIKGFLWIPVKPLCTGLSLSSQLSFGNTTAWGCVSWGTIYCSSC